MMSASSNYLNELQLFYSERLKSKLKKRLSICKGCSNKKQFITREGKLYFTCGSDSGNCGVKVAIDLAKYTFFPELIDTYYKSQITIDKSKHPDIYSTDEINEYQTVNDFIETELSEVRKEYIKLNGLKGRQTMIQKIHKDRMDLKKQQSLLIDKINGETDIGKKKELMKDYIMINQRIMSEYIELNETCNDINNFIMKSEPKITKDNPNLEKEEIKPRIVEKEESTSDIEEEDEDVEEVDELNKVTDIGKFAKNKDVYEKDELEDCKNNITWMKLSKLKTNREYTDYLKEISTNPKYITFNHIYFHAGDELQFERYGFLQSRMLHYPKKSNKLQTIFDGNNSITTYKTFEYMFNKLKKGVYVVIRNNKLAAYLPFSNANYVNNWVDILRKPENKEMVDKMRHEKLWNNKREYKNLADPTQWYANNCIFRPERMRFQFAKFIQEGDKTIAPFKQFLTKFMEHIEKSGKKINDVEFFFNPRDFPVLKENYLEPYDHIFGDKEIEDEYKSDIYTPILSQCSNKQFHDIAIPTEDDMLRLDNDRIYQQNDGCGNNYQTEYKFNNKWETKKPICVFRGSATGCGNTFDTNMRIKAAMMSYQLKQQGKDLLDAKLTSWNRKPKMYNGILTEINPKDFPNDFIVNKQKNYMNLEEQSNHKYVLNIDGHVKAFRLSNEMRMHSVILLVDSPYTLWFQDKLKPYVHFVPVSDDLSDLESQIEWCRDNDSKCKTIADNAYNFYKQYLEKDGVYNWFEGLLSDLSKIRVEPTIKTIPRDINVIVAYRDTGDGLRKSQLDIFVKQMDHILKNTVKKYTINIIEQESDRSDIQDVPDTIKQPNSSMAKFNLGRLKNIGFHIASENASKDVHYIMSDLDLIPSVNLIEDYLTYPKKPIHLANKGTRYNLDGKNKSFLGGVLSVNKDDFTKSNGYPNNFWGWGGEDDALKKRFDTVGIKINKPEYPVIDLEDFQNFGEKNQYLKENKMKENLKREKVDYDKIIWKTNGLNDIDLTYEILKKDKYQNMKSVNHTIVKLNIMEYDRMQL